LFNFESLKIKLEEEIRILTIKLNNSRKTLGDSSSANHLEDIESLRGWKKIAQCGVCEFRIKSHVILRCMHVFCKECIDTRLETRQRKCPQCGGIFGHADVKHIFI
jgi:E3 ubiquitin-protein ligase BRE1